MIRAVPRSFALVLVLSALFGCARSESAARAAPPEKQAPKTLEGDARNQLAPLREAVKVEAGVPILALGDLHGDLDATRRALRLSGAIDAKDHWAGERMVVVQVGDQIDRGDDDREVLDLTERLHTEAAQAGGAFLSLSGNHELMNVALDFRYVTPGGFAAFVDARGRGAAFQPGGPYARMLAERPLAARVGSSLFVHGGILPKHVSYGLERLHGEVRDWLLGKRSEPPALAAAEDSPVWTRLYGTEAADCAALDSTLRALGAKRMIVGHTVQPGGISRGCDGKLWRIDVGMSKYYGGPVQVLKIEGDSVSVLRER
jgi:hypothetical protein